MRRSTQPRYVTHRSAPRQAIASTYRMVWGRRPLRTMRIDGQWVAVNLPFLIRHLFKRGALSDER